MAHENIQEDDRISITSEDILLRIALLWGAHNHKQKKAFNEIVEKHLDTSDWATIGSIVCSPLCKPEYLNHFATKLKQRGYGYLLRVVARNPSTRKDTLEDITNDTTLDKRYREVAKASLERGNHAANNQI